MKVPVRKNNRLLGYDYSAEGLYFITICTHERKNTLSDVVVGAIHESPAIRLRQYGKICKEMIEKVPERFSVIITDYVIMPNHIHLIIWIKSEDGFLHEKNRALREAPLRNRSLISKIVGYIKMNASKRIHAISPNQKVWQRNYFDHIIRDYNEYIDVSQYIHDNPGKWMEDRFYQK